MSMLSLLTGNVYYEVVGEGEPLVCVGGFTADHHVWDSIVPILSKHFQLILFDNPGSGQSSIPDKEFAINDFADVVIALCDYLDVKKAYFLGNSMGGAIVQQLAYACPERVRKAVISNSFMSTRKLGFSLFAKARESWFESNLSEESIIHAMLSWCFSGGFLREGNINTLTELNLNAPYPQTKAGYQFQLQALLLFDSSEWLKEVSVPCLFVASDEDAICFPSQIQVMASQVESSQYFLVQGAGHLPHIEHPQLFSDKLLEFLV